MNKVKQTINTRIQSQLHSSNTFLGNLNSRHVQINKHFTGVIKVFQLDTILIYLYMCVILVSVNISE